MASPDMQIGGRIAEGSQSDQYGRVKVTPGISLAQWEALSRAQETKQIANQVLPESESFVQHLGKGAIEFAKYQFSGKSRRDIPILLGGVILTTLIGTATAVTLEKSGQPENAVILISTAVIAGAALGIDHLLRRHHMYYSSRIRK